MRWKGTGPNSIISDAGYVVARFHVNKKEVFRASLQGRFIGGTYDTGKEAKEVCERHLKAKS